MESYTFWYHHGERVAESGTDEGESEDVESGEEIKEIIRDLYPSINESEFDKDTSNYEMRGENPNLEAEKFYRLLKDLDEEVYPGCKTSKLAAVIKLLHIKSLGQWTNRSFDMLLEWLFEILPNGCTLPKSYYEAKQIVKDLGLSDKKMDACINNCMLYWKEEENSDLCNICGSSRWKENNNDGEVKVKSNGKKVPRKILRYFPLKPRLQRLFMSKKTTSLMRWHHGRKDDGVMRHPTDSIEWKSFNELHKEFSSEPRNVRLGLSSDGFQPFSHSKTPYSIWPVILIPYNFPPQMCMKESNFILSMIIQGPESPGDTIDVYLKPLIEELKELWEVGVETFDASTRQNFRLHASLLWTINDFPAYANLSGWSTKGKLACPCCNKETSSLRLTNCKKKCYMGHRRYLPHNHKWRNDRSNFDGEKELRSPPKLVTGFDVLDQVKDLTELALTKDINKKVKISHDKRGDNWNKWSIFFELPYWSSLLLRHNLDVMHIEKNICENVLGTIMSVKGMSKDTFQARLDLN
ncbi:uncharacterized protein LOC126668452 [Mercurialis annua]|uniref:uncharacterized protein LOC126668452 n=1 Tax=Mercurialis annua TaxID=3986 RepID=UPI00216061BD|nr:uncharacterized protein LOC126668452 [Mercurialis annua]